MFNRGDTVSSVNGSNPAAGAKDYINPHSLSNPLPHRPVLIASATY